MVENFYIAPPSDSSDSKGARRVFEDFWVLYQPTLEILENHLEKMIETTEAAYAMAYKPWHKGLQTLLRGVFLMAKKIPLPDSESFLDALRMFSFDGAVSLLYNLCHSCKIKVGHDWAEKFQEHINLLLTSMAILNRSRQSEPAHSR